MNFFKIYSATVLPLFLFLSLNIGNAQSQKDTLQASIYFKKGDTLSILRDYPNSNKAFQEAVHLYEKAGAWERLARSYNKMSLNFLNAYQLEKSISHAEKALEVCTSKLKKDIKESANALDIIAQVYFLKLDFDKTLTNFEKALKIKERIYPKYHKEIGLSYKNLGDTYLFSGFNDEALKHYGIALKINKKVLEANHPNNETIYYLMAGAYVNNGEFDRALEYSKKALSMRVNAASKNYFLIALSHIQIANFYGNMGNYDEELAHLKKSYDFILKNERKTDLAFYYGALAMHYERQGNYEASIEYLFKRLDIWGKILGGYHPSVIEIYSRIGEGYTLSGNYEKGKEHLNKALESYKKILSNGNHYQIAKVYNSLGVLHNLKKEYKKAILNFDEVLSIFETLANDNLLSSKNAGPVILLNALKGKASSLIRLYEENGDLNHLKNGISVYKKADKLIGSARQSLQNYNDKLEFSKLAQEVYFGGVQANLLLYETQQGDSHLNTTFLYAEKSKSNTLHELLSAKSFSGLPDTLVELENTFKGKRSYYQSKIAEQLNSKNIDSIALLAFENKLFTVNRGHDSLTEVLEKKYPKYHQLKYNTSIIDIAGVQKKLDSKTTFLEYFSFEENTFVFAISKGSFQIKKLDTPDLLDKIGQLRNALEEKNLSLYKEISRTLYLDLMDPIADRFMGEKLVIVPDGPLWHLNFDLLLTEKSISKNPKELPYLLKKYAISYANSANLLFNRPEDPHHKTLNQVLAFSYTDTTAVNKGDVLRMGALRDAGEDLPGTRREISAIAQIVDGVYYYGKEAVEANFKKDADSYNVVHLALHGDVDNELPQNSKLYFTKNKDSLEDNLLYSHELFAMNIPAELTVLSACNTGTGKIAKGEGIMSLGNAFQYAGTKSLLLSSWEVADDTAPELMQYFYANLKEGMDKPKALQQAKLEYLSTISPERSNPFYWGNFYLIGNPDSINLNTSSYWYWILGGVIVLIIGLFIFNRRRRKSAF